MLSKSISRYHPFSASARDCALYVLYSEPGTHLKKTMWNFCERKEKVVADEICKFRLASFAKNIFKVVFFLWHMGPVLQSRNKPLYYATCTCFRLVTLLSP